MSRLIPLRRIGIYRSHICRRLFSFQPTRDLEYVQRNYEVHRRGDAGYGSREYLLLPPGARVHDVAEDPTLPAAKLLAHRNIVFGARSLRGFAMKDVCLALVDEAVQESGFNGEQPQAIASLAGLCDWARNCLESSSGSVQLEIIQSTNPAALEAVQAIATGIPRPGRSVVGAGTFRDAEEDWKKIAREFVDLGLSEEASLYQEKGARFVGIEHLADRNPDYLASAGGAMARLFFL